MIRDDDGAPSDTDVPIALGAQMLVGIALMTIFGGMIWLLLTPH